ncbi:MAG: hypothetical protein ACRDDZ_03845 [Marinifilaceae bacterium]
MKKLILSIVCLISCSCIKAENINKILLDGGFNFNKGYLVGIAYDRTIPTWKSQGVGIAFDYIQTRRKHLPKSDYNPYVAVFSPQYRYSFIDRYFFLDLTAGIPLGFTGYSDRTNKGSDVRFTYGVHLRASGGYHIDDNWSVSIWVKDMVLARSHTHINTFLGGASIGYRF